MPRFELVSRAPPFVAYRFLRGEPLVDEDAAGVRAVLEALHALDPETLPLARSDWIADYRAQCAEFERAVLPLLDWGDARIGDPALDYAWLLHGPFASWEVDDDLRRRARFYHRLAPWFEAHYGLFVESREHLDRGLKQIRERL